MQNKTTRTFLLEDSVIKKIDELAVLYGGLNRTSLLKVIINEIYNLKYEKKS